MVADEINAEIQALAEEKAERGQHQKAGHRIGRHAEIHERKTGFGWNKPEQHGSSIRLLDWQTRGTCGPQPSRHQKPRKCKRRKHRGDNSDCQRDRKWDR